MISKSVLAGTVFTLSIVCLYWLVGIHDFPLIVLFFTLAFGGYYYIIKSSENFQDWMKLGWAIRILALFAFPALSDDIYRFIWDGWLITEGRNPFSMLPSELNVELDSFHTMLLEKMNSPDYYSVYPPVLQLIFTTVAWLVPSSILAQSILMKFILLAFEWITVHYSLKLLILLKKPKKYFLFYFLNPLVIVELMGNLHMELIMISLFSMFLYYLSRFLHDKLSQKKKFLYLASFALSLSVAGKLITILVSPFLLKRLSFKMLLRFSISLGAFLLLFFTPMFLFTYENFGKGLDLYFQKFEFNASIYYLIREIGYWYKGYNIIGSLGPSLALISGGTILALAYFEKEKSIASLCKYLTIGLTIYYSLGTTIHPWYTSLLVFLAVFSNLRYPLFWSYLIVLSYAKYYMDGEYYYVMITLEYVGLFILIIREYFNSIGR